MEPVEPPVDRRLLVLVAHEAGDDGEVRVDVVADRVRSTLRARRSSRRSIAVASSGLMNENVSAPMPRSAAMRIVSRREHATHSGGCGRCNGFGTTLRAGIEKCLPAWPRYGVSSIIVVISPTASSHISRFVARSISKPASSMSLRRLAGAELDAAVGHEVERGDALGDAGRVVVAGQRGDDAVAEADVLGALAGARRGTPRARTSGCTPRGSGARPPTRCRTRAGPRARPARGLP